MLPNRNKSRMFYVKSHQLMNTHRQARVVEHNRPRLSALGAVWFVQSKPTNIAAGLLLFLPHRPATDLVINRKLARLGRKGYAWKWLLFLSSCLPPCLPGAPASAKTLSSLGSLMSCLSPGTLGRSSIYHTEIGLCA